MTCPQSMKFVKLKRRLGLPHWQIVGLLESLWIFTQMNAPAGNIGKHTDEDIAAGIDWAGDHEKLIADLVDCGWLDRCEVHRLLVHDWEDHVPTYLKGSMAKNGREFAKQGAELVAKQPAKHGAKQPAKQNQTDPEQNQKAPEQSAPSLVLSSLALPNLEKPTPAAAETSVGSERKRPNPKPADESCPLFARFWAAYPNKVGKPNAAKAFARHSPDEALLSKILAAIAHWSRTENWTKDGGKYIPQPTTWLNRRGWEDEQPQIRFTQVGDKIETPEERTARLERERRRISGVDED